MKRNIPRKKPRVARPPAIPHPFFPARKIVASPLVVSGGFPPFVVASKLAVHLVMLFFLVLPSVGCGSSSSSPAASPTPTPSPVYRYFDREVYLPTGVSVSPEDSAAQAIIQSSLQALANQTDLGLDYFIFLYDEDSILQPVVTATSSQGKNWESFIQVWDDATYNTFAVANVGVAKDQDLVVALNSVNTQQFYMISRLSCYVAAESCGFPSQGQTQAMLWRAFGYLVGMKDGAAAGNALMQPGVSAAQEAPAEIAKYIAEFNGQLERLKQGLPAAH